MTENLRMVDFFFLEGLLLGLGGFAAPVGCTSTMPEREWEAGRTGRLEQAPDGGVDPAKSCRSCGLARAPPSLAAPSLAAVGAPKSNRPRDLDPMASHSEVVKD